MSITEFLAARLDEDEAAAKALFFAARIPDKTPDFFAAGGPAAEAFWERFEPARVLREVAAKRKILAEHQATCCPGKGFEQYMVDWPCDTIRNLAAVWSGHPEYDPAWKP